ncbi:tyrosine-type recombinase/integrase [Modestobacter sp. I12A-02628]|uniref:Site-specific integrase n=1 Tax=Goekera deserti TaxID=2497753 RepID=A0A7K3WEH7_9ACTN|nr:site-specific integrase [Goekera deserti]MPQ99678.1 tyrosine-type recombinase/integrase [Goekera deserti]NDI46312.1 tyrosine-type recombinase/integrase [Goekera deserti]NEL54756.1 site-specific integrase [Goekera deserti]
MAYIRKLPSGKWQATVRHPSGRKVTKTDVLKRVVTAWAAETEVAFRHGEIRSERGRQTTVAQWHEQWAPARTVARTTEYQQVLRLRRTVLPYWGSWPLRSIGRIDVQAWVKSLQSAGTGAHAVQSAYMVFAKLMADAVLEGLLPTTPCQKIELPKAELPAPRWLSREEYQRLLLAFDGQPHGERWRALVAVACHSGLRSGELAGLDVGAVDFERGLIRVGQVTTPFGLRPYPKTDLSRRSVPVHPDALALLWPLVADRPADAPAFPAPRGGRIEQSNYSRYVWRPALQRAGIEHVRPYVTRHTFASWLVQDGVPLWDIAQALGHSSTAMVSRYAFLAPDAHANIRAAWERAGASADVVAPGPGGAPRAHDGPVAHVPHGDSAAQRATDRR